MYSRQSKGSRFKNKTDFKVKEEDEAEKSVPFEHRLWSRLVSLRASKHLRPANFGPSLFNPHVRTSWLFIDFQLLLKEDFRLLLLLQPEEKDGWQSAKLRSNENEPKGDAEAAAAARDLPRTYVPTFSNCSLAVEWTNEPGSLLLPSQLLCRMILFLALTLGREKAKRPPTFV